jgi:Ser/Thr protein kinase RdoA (MazF antagonist)
MPETAVNDRRVLEMAETLSGGRVQSVRPARSGANSQIFQVQAATGRFALKSYPARPDDPRSRADVEWQALRFLRKHCGDLVPAPIARDAAGHFMLMEWIEGEPVAEHDASDVSHAANFIARIFAASSDPEAAAFPLASEACLFARSIVDQIEARLSLLSSEPAVRGFLAEYFLPALAAAKESVADELASGNPLELESRRLIPADFGFHNAIRSRQGLRYIDFDYFGWDDPVKLVADFMLHPAMNLSAEDRNKFAGLMAAVLARDAHWRARLCRHLPLYALRWVLILFNPFRRDRAAGLDTGGAEHKALIDDRLRKAQVLMRAVQAEDFGQFE